MKRSNNIIWGIVFLAASAVLFLNAFDIADIHLFFDGWWTLFIIIPCLVGLINDEDKTSNIVGLIIGILLFLACRDIFSFAILRKIAIPGIIALIGFKMLFKDSFGRKRIESDSCFETADNHDKTTFAAFSGQKLSYDREVFQGADLTAIFGGITCDLRYAIFENDVAINTCSVFGGIDILVPAHVNVKVNSNSLFGGVNAKKHENRYDNTRTIYINSTCMFGGVDVK